MGACFGTGMARTLRIWSVGSYLRWPATLRAAPKKGAAHFNGWCIDMKIFDVQCAVR